MLGSITNTLKKIFGDKSDKDIKVSMPLVNKSNEIFATLQNISNDELRAKTATLKAKNKNANKTSEDEIDTLNKHVADNPQMEIRDNEAIFKQVDDLTKKIDQTIESVLLEILPEAFAIVKETANRFKNNETLIVTATDFDRDLAATRDRKSVV